MKCAACNRDLPRKEIVYAQDKQTYCSNPFECNERHPNSVVNILARDGAVQLYSEHELESVLFDNMDVSEEMKERIEKVATKPQSIRLSKIDIAYYLVKLQEERGFNSLSEAIRYCVEAVMRMENAIAPGAPVKDQSAVVTSLPQNYGTQGIRAVVPNPSNKASNTNDEKFVF